MTPEHARSLLGVSETATNAEIATAYRRLIADRAPGHLHGPEAERPAHEASEARTTLSHKGEPGAGGVPPTWTDPADGNQDHDEQQLQEIVLRVLDHCGRTATATALVMQTLRDALK